MSDKFFDLTPVGPGRTVDDALYEISENERLRAERAKLDAEIERLRADARSVRGVLLELRLRLHAQGRRPQECYEMSLIDEVLKEQER